MTNHGLEQGHAGFTYAARLVGTNMLHISCVSGSTGVTRVHLMVGHQPSYFSTQIFATKRGESYFDFTVILSNP